MDEAAPRREGFRREHPVFFWGSVALIALFVLAAGAVAMRIPRYNREAQGFTQQMTAAQKQTQAELLRHREQRTKLAVALLQRDMRIRSLETNKRHLAIVLKDSVLELRQGRATLRRAKLAIGPDSIVRAPDGRQWRFVRGMGERHIASRQQNPTITVPEWVYVSRGQPVPPEGERRVAGGMGAYLIALDDGTQIYSQPQAGPLKDVVIPAGFMARARDLVAIFDAVKEDTPVYIY
ncbi:hypothetical protein [Longimicrobium sp.]|uniref:hypothetical protein n=1 Tax=Longimicrobium sp. TaxID=2029185 RepID=UPI002CB285FF|nr:hypothetical protein [Longimicrobium sp.]HSU14174.1 hypothetical protein [Longimicrobium sp.]